MRTPVAHQASVVDASGSPLLPPDRAGEERLRRLRVVALVVPAAFLLLVLCFRSVLVGRFSPGHGHLLIDAILVMGTLGFSLVMFSMIDRSYQVVLQENRDLAAVDAVAAAARSAYTVDSVAQACLEAVLEATGARAVRIVAAHPADPRRTPDVWSRESDSATAGVEEVVPLTSGPEAIGSLTFVDLPRTTPLSAAAYAGMGRAVGSSVQRARYMAVLQRENHDATRAERDRIAREMHDGLAQALGAAHFRLLALSTHPDVAASPEVRHEIDTIASDCHDAYTDVRETILGLRQNTHAGHTLAQSLETYIEKFAARSGIPTTLQTGLAGLKLPEHHEIQVVRVVQEALTNVRKHSGATSACVRIEAQPDSVVVMVEDDGHGFDTRSVGSDRYGLATMSERTQLLDGWLTVDSSPGHGTRVTLGVPCADAASTTSASTHPFQPTDSLNA